MQKARRSLPPPQPDAPIYRSEALDQYAPYQIQWWMDPQGNAVFRKQDAEENLNWIERWQYLRNHENVTIGIGNDGRAVATGGRLIERLTLWVVLQNVVIIAHYQSATHAQGLLRQEVEVEPISAWRRDEQLGLPDS